MIYIKIIKLFCKWLPPIVSQKLRSLLISNNYAKKCSNEIAARSVTGSYLTININGFYDLPFYINGYFDWRVLAIAKAVCDLKGSIIEVGSNIGTETIAFIDIVNVQSKVYAFEPVPVLLKKLKALENRNKNLNVYPFAISNSNNFVKFDLPGSQNNSGIGHILINERNKNRFIDVECRKLDFFLNTFQKISLIHIDAEGSDLNVILGAKKIIKRDQPIIIAELSPKLLMRYDQDVKIFIATLNQFGYSVHNISRLSTRKFKTHFLKFNKNVICVPSNQKEILSKINKMLFFAGILPMIKHLNPLKIVKQKDY